MIKSNCKSIFLNVACCGLLATCVSSIRAQEQMGSMGHMHGQHKEQQRKDEKPQMTRLVIPDVEILNQNGEKQRIYSDLVKGKTVVINFIYTTCTTVCPLSADYFSRLQTLLGERMGKDVFLISITTDPETDSPARLKEWSARFKPKAGWTFVTGETSVIEKLLLALIGEGPRRGYHTPIAFLVNDESGAWKRVYGLESPTSMLDMLGQMSTQAKQ